MTPEAMKSAAQTPCVALSTYLKLSRDKGDLICFFEGIKDHYYYQSRVEAITGKPLKSVPCGNKQSVLEMFMKRDKHPSLISDAKSKCVFVFFVDRDYDDLINNPEICETKGYSIENYYTNPEAFHRLVVGYLGIEEGTSDYDRLMELYLGAFNQFHGVVNTFNAFYRIVRKKKMPIVGEHLGEKFPRDLASLGVLNCQSHYTLAELNQKYGVSVSQHDLDESLKELSKEDLFMAFRGKYEMEFYFMLLTYIFSNSKKILSKKISLTLNGDKIMSDIAQYATCPVELHKYITKHHQYAQNK